MSIFKNIYSISIFFISNTCFDPLYAHSSLENPQFLKKCHQKNLKINFYSLSNSSSFKTFLGSPFFIHRKKLKKFFNSDKTRFSARRSPFILFIGSVSAIILMHALIINFKHKKAKGELSRTITVSTYVDDSNQGNGLNHENISLPDLRENSIANGKANSDINAQQSILDGQENSIANGKANSDINAQQSILDGTESNKISLPNSQETFIADGKANTGINAQQSILNGTESNRISLPNSQENSIADSKANADINAQQSILNGTESNRISLPNSQENSIADSKANADINAQQSILNGTKSNKISLPNSQENSIADSKANADINAQQSILNGTDDHVGTNTYQEGVNSCIQSKSEDESPHTNINEVLEDVNLFTLEEYESLQSAYIECKFEFCTALVNAYLQQDEKLNIPHNTPLHYAVKYNHYRVVEFLLNFPNFLQKINIDAYDINGYALVHNAARSDEDNSLKLLVERGADVNKRTHNGITPLHCAAFASSTSAAKYLLENNATINAKDNDGFTPLHCAARSGEDNSLKLLVERGADVNQRTHNGITPLHCAALVSSTSAAKYLLENNATINAKDSEGFTPLHYAARSGEDNSLKLLVERGADVNQRTHNGITPLHCAALVSSTSAAKYLLENNATINAKDSEGFTPLHYAASCGNAHTLSLLFQHKAELTEADCNGNTPLHLAVIHKNLAVIEWLIKKNVPINIKNFAEYTPFQCAFLQQDENSEDCSEIVRIFISLNAGTDLSTETGYDALVLALKKNKTAICHALVNAYLQQGEKLNIPHNTPLHYAAKNNHLPVVNFLVCHPININAKNCKGNTALHIAKMQKNKVISNILHAKGAK